jgi:hypothetical protein
MSTETIKSLSNSKIVAIVLGIVAIIILIVFFGAKPCSVNILGVSLQFSCEETKAKEGENTNPIAGTWVAKAGEDNAQIDLIITVASNCEVENICGTINLPSITCQASIYLRNIDGNRYYYDAVDHQGNCGPAGNEYLELGYDGTLEQSYNGAGTTLRRK